MTPEERRARLRQRTVESATDRGQRGLGKGLRVPFDLAVLGGKEVVWYELTANHRESNMFDIIPWEVRNPAYSSMRQFTGKANNRVVGDWDYKLEICIHKKIGVSQSPVLCLREMFGHKCAICDDMFDEYKKRGTSEFNEKTAKALQPQWRVVYVVYDYRDQKHVGFKLWDIAYKSFEEYLMTKAENDPSGLVVFSDPFDGRIIQVEGKIKKIGTKDYVEPAGLTFLSREEPYTEEDVTGNYPLDKMLIIPTVEEVTRLYLGMDSEGADQEAEPSMVSSGRRRQAAQQPIVDEMCPAGGTVGKSLFTFSECDQTCPENLFQRCSQLNAELGPGEKGDIKVAPVAEIIPKTTPVPPQRATRHSGGASPTPPSEASSATLGGARRSRR